MREGSLPGWAERPHLYFGPVPSPAWPAIVPGPERCEGTRPNPCSRGKHLKPENPALINLNYEFEALRIVRGGQIDPRRRMALMVPVQFPHDVKAMPKLLGEGVVYDALRAGLDDSWWVFHDRPVRGTPRRVDFIAINRERGVVAIEVKGGLVHASRGVFRQVIAQSGQRKRIDPFGQLKLGFARVCGVAGVAC
jgi:hypothetical protein